MNPKLKIIVLLFIATLSCKKETANLLTFSDYSEEFKGVCSNGDCAEVIIDFIKINGDTEAASRINYVIGGSIIYFLNSEIDKKIKATTITEASKVFLKSYENDRKEFPETSPYSAEVNVAKSYSSPLLLSIETNYSSFTGGVHGYQKTGFLNFDPNNGNLITTSSLFKNKEEFTNFAEQLFREKNKIAESDAINSTGFWFKNDKFHLPESIGFSDENVVLIYNQYEIASYAEGVIELLIPLEEAKPYLTF